MIGTEQLAEALNDGFLNVDADWRVTYASRRARQMLRRPELDAGMSLRDLIPDEPGTAAWRELERAAEKQVMVEFDVFYPSLFAWHEVRVIPAGSGVALLLRDITDRQWLLRKEAERAYLRNLFNDAPIAISITRGPEHQFEFSNTFARQLIGGRNIEGLTIRQAFPDLTGQGFFELLDRVYKTGEAVHGSEMKAQLTDPETGRSENLYVNFSYLPLRGFDAQVSGILALSVDVTPYVHDRMQREP